MASPTCFARQLQQRCRVHIKAARLECECHELYMKVRHDVFPVSAGAFEHGKYPILYLILGYTDGT